MRAAVLREYGEPLEVTEVDRPEPAPHGVVVEVEACGICRSDWHAWMGHGEWADDQVPIGQILGHEPAGRVVAAGDTVERIREGDRVALPFNVGDGTCPECRNGHGNVCEDGYALGFEADAPGAFAEAVHLPYADYNAMHLPDGVSPRDVAALGCRFMTAYHALTHRAGVEGGDWVAIHGCGGVGLSAVQVAAALGARVVAVDIRESALARAADLGADATVNASEVGDGTAGVGGDSAGGRASESESGVPDAIEALTGGGADVSLDALGRAETCRNSVRCLRQRGTHVQVGLTTDAERGEVSLPTDWMTRWEVEFLGARGMPPTRYDDLLALLEAGGLDPGALVSREVSLAEVPERLQAMTDYETDGVEVMTSI